MKFILTTVFVSAAVMASPILPMNRAFNSLMELIPFLADKAAFQDQRNQEHIQKNLRQLDDAFKAANHEALLKNELFAPSLALTRENLSESAQAFEKGKKDFAHWRLKELTAQCLDCHTRLPVGHSSSFQDGQRRIDEKKVKTPYNLGIAQLIVRLYPEAKSTFTRAVDDRLLKKQFQDIILPLKQILLIHTKIQRDPEGMLSVIRHYESRQGFSRQDRDTMKTWKERLEIWNKSPYKKAHLGSEEEVKKFINERLEPLFKQDVYLGKFDVDLLFASGLLSNFFFENPQSALAPDLMLWLGRAEKYLQRENFFGSGDHFLKLCVKRWPASAAAKKCLDEYKESMTFQFTGSRGTDMPPEIQSELKELEALVKKKK
jgi:hypothetical protein